MRKHLFNNYRKKKNKSSHKTLTTKSFFPQIITFSVRDLRGRRSVMRGAAPAITLPQGLSTEAGGGGTLILLAPQGMNGSLTLN